MRRVAKKREVRRREERDVESRFSAMGRRSSLGRLRRDMVVCWRGGWIGYICRVGYAAFRSDKGFRGFGTLGGVCTFDR